MPNPRAGGRQAAICWHDLRYLPLLVVETRQTRSSASNMTQMNRRRFIASITATTTCAAAEVGGAAAISAASPLSPCGNALPPLIAAGHSIGEIAPGWKPIVAAALEIMTAIDPDLEIRQI